MTNGLVAVWINSASAVRCRCATRLAPDRRADDRHPGRRQHRVRARWSAGGAGLSGAARGPTRSRRNLSGEGEVSFSAATLDEPLGWPTSAGGFDVRHILAGPRTTAWSCSVTSTSSRWSRSMTGDWGDLVEAAEGCRLRTPPPSMAGARTARSCSAAPVGSRRWVPTLAARRRRSRGRSAPARWPGFFTYGEFARVTGSTGFHNATVVVLAL